LRKREGNTIKRTLIVLAHPGLEDRSIANRIVVERIRTLEQVKIKDQALADHDRVGIFPPIAGG
jgi:molybdopterin converting factor small subunit